MYKFLRIFTPTFCERGGESSIMIGGFAQIVKDFCFFSAFSGSRYCANEMNMIK